MLYRHHLRSLLEAHSAAVPYMSRACLCERAGLGATWISTFLRREAATLSSAERLITAIRDTCPAGPEGDEVRRLLAVFECDEPTKADAA